VTFGFCFLDFFFIPIVFYIIAAICGASVEGMRDYGWIFDIGKSEPWWKFYTYYGSSEGFDSKESGYTDDVEDLKNTDWLAIWATMPTQLALYALSLHFRFWVWTDYVLHHRLFFNVLHPPLNVPALGKSLLKSLMGGSNRDFSYQSRSGSGSQQGACRTWILEPPRWHRGDGVSANSRLGDHR
jgi:hypothetical protein